MASAVSDNGGTKDPSEIVFGRRNSILRKLFERAIEANKMKDLIKQSNEYFEVCIGLIKMGHIADASKIAEKIQTEEIQKLITETIQANSPRTNGAFLPTNRNIVEITKECERKRSSLSSASSKYSSE